MNSVQSSAHYRDTAASPGAIPPQPACRQTCRSHMDGWLRVRMHRRAAARRLCLPKRKNDWTRTIPNAQRSRRRQPRRHQGAPLTLQGRFAAARRGPGLAWPRYFVGSQACLAAYRPRSLVSSQPRLGRGQQVLRPCAPGESQTLRGRLRRNSTGHRS